MAAKDQPDATNRAEEAINAILAAEQRSHEQLARRRAEAAQIVSDARAMARRIHQRADTRSVALHGLWQRRAAALAAEFEAGTQAVRSRPVEVDAARAGELAQAVAALAAELTGGGE